MVTPPDDTTPPFPIEPMRGTAGQLPQGVGWVYELKWDGIRMLAHISDGAVRLQSSNGRDITVAFPELAALASLGEGYDGMVLDGEVVAFADGKPSFHTLQHRLHVVDPDDAKRRARAIPVVFVAFDLLWLDGIDATPLPLSHRRSLLEQVVEAGPVWRLCEQHHDATGLLDAVIASDLEGVMAKRGDSPYSVGRRSASWVKIKPRKRQEFVVGGWLSGRGQRGARLGSLLVGCFEGDELVFAGRAGSGLSDNDIVGWQTALVAQPECPFVNQPEIVLEGRTVTWCRPDQVAEIAFAEWPRGQQLRHPVVLGRRHDADPRSVTREE